MKRGQRFKVEPVTANDARELDLFERYLRHRAADLSKTDAQHYADVYGEVVFGAETEGGQPQGERPVPSAPGERPETKGGDREFYGALCGPLPDPVEGA